MSVEELISTYISYNGIYYQIERDYGSHFKEYINSLYYELRKCSLFESKDRPNTLAIRSQINENTHSYEFIIYQTDENGHRISPILTYVNQFQATKKYLEMYTKDNPDVNIHEKKLAS